MKKSILVGLLVMLMMSNAYAEEERKKDVVGVGDVLVGAGVIVALETVTLLMSEGLAQDRGGFAATIALLAPMGGTGMKGTNFIFFESIMAYNILIDTVFSGTFSDKNVFWQNVVLLNAYNVYQILYSEDEASKDDEGVKVGLAPIKDGMQLSMQYQF